MNNEINVIFNQQLTQTNLTEQTPTVVELVKGCNRLSDAKVLIRIKL